MSYSDVVDKLSSDLPLFESESDRDSFLKQSIGMIKDAFAADMAAIFIYDEDEGNLAFRTGVDVEGMWDRMNCPVTPGSRFPFRFELDGNDVGRAFTEGRVIKHSYEANDIDHPFKAKLIIPVAKGPLRFGVLVLAGNDPASFHGVNEGELLGTVTRLGDLLEDASALISRPLKEKSSKKVIIGKKAGEGIAEGTAFPFWIIDENDAEVASAKSVDEELFRFDEVLDRSIEQLELIRKKAEAGISETGGLIFLAQILMLRDETFTGAMRTLIQEGMPARSAIKSVVNDYAARFSQMAEQRLAEKAQDVRDLGHRLTTNFSNEGNRGFSYAGRITLAKHIYPSDLFRLSLEGVSGVVLLGAAVTAHISILAQSLGLPVLITDDKSILDIADGTPLLLDADRGSLIIDPVRTDLEDYRKRMSSAEVSRDSYRLKGQTSDGTLVNVMANINILKDAEDARRQGAEGIGLYRSEFPFILKNDILSEEQQYQIYSSIAKTQAGKPVTFRTADIGGDKIMQGREEPEDNPFLGVRGIRFSLAHREMFRDQIRAMLRAGRNSDLGIMLPMVSGVEEVIEAKAEIERCKKDLRERGVPFHEEPRIGAMVELPSAALAVRELAVETDFLSIGTNDLTMYLLAVDRTNEALSHLYRSHHPTVLRTLARIVDDAGDFGGDVSVCGDAAADPTLTAFFVGIGIRKLSVSPRSVEPLKDRLASFTLQEAENVAKEMLSIGRVSEMENWLESYRNRLAIH